MDNPSSLFIDGLPYSEAKKLVILMRKTLYYQYRQLGIALCRMIDSIFTVER